MSVTKAKGLRSTFIAVVVVKKNDKFVSVQEPTGWYLPAGRVDYGESFACGAIRETLEEAGAAIKLTGIYRIQHSYSRCRFIFGAELVDDNAPLKTEPDADTLRAEWVTIEELKQKNLRHSEVLSIFCWVNDGAPLYPIDILDGVNGNEIDNKNVVTHVTHDTKVVFQKRNMFLAVRKDDSFALPCKELLLPIKKHKHNAIDLIKTLNISGTITGIIKVIHRPPATRKIPEGTFTVIYQGVLNDPGDDDKALSLSTCELVWIEPTNFSVPKEAEILTQFLKDSQVAPLGLIKQETDIYTLK